ncbi:hypothetical protein S40285_06576 [Stachybotrys chlorohalonatus IBT 40285]|uniref:Uncharacterized protein n=1 Tax=Stachybotrys chlorohalonatus (strain IBT 40285) TaxID=1283841 RepID=A0A084QD39_STAC4|nr:hypothetical protein S40285_06576 [Stachybotrys chlorohalonata IBT 40285]
MYYLSSSKYLEYYLSGLNDLNQVLLTLILYLLERYNPIQIFVAIIFCLILTTVFCIAFETATRAVARLVALATVTPFCITTQVLCHIFASIGTSILYLIVRSIADKHTPHGAKAVLFDFGLNNGSCYILRMEPRMPGISEDDASDLAASYEFLQVSYGLLDNCYVAVSPSENTSNASSLESFGWLPHFARNISWHSQPHSSSHGLWKKYKDVARRYINDIFNKNYSGSFTNNERKPNVQFEEQVAVVPPSTEYQTSDNGADTPPHEGERPARPKSRLGIHPSVESNGKAPRRNTQSSSKERRTFRSLLDEINQMSTSDAQLDPNQVIETVLSSAFSRADADNDASYVDDDDNHSDSSDTTIRPYGHIQSHAESSHEDDPTPTQGGEDFDTEQGDMEFANSWTRGDNGSDNIREHLDADRIDSDFERAPDQPHEEVIKTELDDKMISVGPSAGFETRISSQSPKHLVKKDNMELAHEPKSSDEGKGHMGKGNMKVQSWKEQAIKNLPKHTEDVNKDDSEPEPKKERSNQEDSRTKHSATPDNGHQPWNNQARRNLHNFKEIYYDNYSEKRFEQQTDAEYCAEVEAQSSKSHELHEDVDYSKVSDTTVDGVRSEPKPDPVPAVAFDDIQSHTKRDDEDEENDENHDVPSRNLIDDEDEPRAHPEHITPMETPQKQMTATADVQSIYEEGDEDASSEDSPVTVRARSPIPETQDDEDTSGEDSPVTARMRSPIPEAQDSGNVVSEDVQLSSETGCGTPEESRKSNVSEEISTQAIENTQRHLPVESPEDIATGHSDEIDSPDRALEKIISNDTQPLPSSEVSTAQTEGQDTVESTKKLAPQDSQAAAESSPNSETRSSPTVESPKSKAAKDAKAPVQKSSPTRSTGTAAQVSPGNQSSTKHLIPRKKIASRSKSQCKTSTEQTQGSSHGTGADIAPPSRTSRSPEVVPTQVRAQPEAEPQEKLPHRVGSKDDDGKNKQKPASWSPFGGASAATRPSFFARSSRPSAATRNAAVVKDNAKASVPSPDPQLSKIPRRRVEKPVPSTSQEPKEDSKPSSSSSQLVKTSNGPFEGGKDATTSEDVPIPEVNFDDRFCVMVKEMSRDWSPEPSPPPEDQKSLPSAVSPADEPSVPGLPEPAPTADRPPSQPSGSSDDSFHDSGVVRKRDHHDAAPEDTPESGPQPSSSPPTASNLSDQETTAQEEPESVGEQPQSVPEPTLDRQSQPTSPQSPAWEASRRRPWYQPPPPGNSTWSDSGSSGSSEKGLSDPRPSTESADDLIDLGNGTDEDAVTEEPYEVRVQSLVEDEVEERDDPSLTGRGRGRAYRMDGNI